MSDLGVTLWDSYLSLVAEVQRVAEVIGAGLAVAVRLNHDLITLLLNFSSRIVQLLLLLLMKTREMVSLLKCDLIEFLSDVGSGVHLLASALANLGTIVVSADFQHFLRQATILVSTILGLVFIFILCNYCGILQLLAATVNYFLLITIWTAKTIKRLVGGLILCSAIVVVCLVFLLEHLRRASIVVLEKVLNGLVDFIFLVILFSSSLYKYLVLRSRLCAYVQRKALELLKNSIEAFIQICVTLRLNWIYIPCRRFLIFMATVFNYLWRLLIYFRVRLYATGTRAHRANNSEAPPQVNYIYLEQQINNDASDMDVNRLDDYLVARLNMDRHNDMVYHYIVQNNSSRSLYVTVKPLAKKLSFFAVRLNRVKEMLGIAPEVTSLVSRVTWNIDENFITDRKNRTQRARSRATAGKVAADNRDEPQMPECIVCQDRRRSVVLLPCRHLCLCKICCSAIQCSSNRRCPICRDRIESVCNVYI